MDEHELKPCPFCGDKGVVQRSGYCFWVCCSNRDCPIEPRTHWFSNYLSAIKVWNRRADSGVTAQEWISVKDMLPKNDEIVILCTDKNFIYAGELIGDTWFLDNDSWTATVTHWMPLPQPPKGE